MTNYSNSPLATYKLISPNRTSPRNHAIDRFTVHCFVGQVTAKRGCEVFQQRTITKKASCSYVIGYDGSIGLCVEEKDRSWCSSNEANDMRAITFEVASETKSPYKVTDKALNALIDLMVDICKRNGKTKVLWFGDKKKTLAYNPKPDEMVMTVHRWFAPKSCPGDYLYGKHPYIAEEVTKRLQGKKSAFVYGGVDYSDVFDAKYYYSRYKDLQNFIGNNEAALFNHFTAFGMKEGRQAKETFNVQAYKNRYEDLQNAFGNNLPLYYLHYIQFGKNEKRIAT